MVSSLTLVGYSALVWRLPGMAETRGPSVDIIHREADTRAPTHYAVQVAQQGLRTCQERAGTSMVRAMGHRRARSQRGPGMHAREVVWRGTVRQKIEEKGERFVE